MASGMGVLPGRERQASVQQALQGLCPSLQAEFPGGGGVLSALSFPPFQKVRELGFKTGKETAVAFFPCRDSMISHVGAAGCVCIGKKRIFTFRQNRGAVIGSKCPVAAPSFKR